MEFNIKFDEKMLVETANRVLDEYEYRGKTIREWANLIANPKTNADRIRSMTDEELADFLGGIFTIETDIWGDYDPRLVVTQEPRVEIRDKEGMMDWLKSPVEVDE